MLRNSIADPLLVAAVYKAFRAARGNVVDIHPADLKFRPLKGKTPVRYLSSTNDDLGKPFDCFELGVDANKAHWRIGVFSEELYGPGVCAETSLEISILVGECRIYNGREWIRREDIKHGKNDTIRILKGTPFGIAVERSATLLFVQTGAICDSKTGKIDFEPMPTIPVPERFTQERTLMEWAGT